MKYTSIFEKLACLFKLTSSSWINISFLAVIILLVVLLVTKKITLRKCLIFIVFSYLLILGITIYTYYSSLSGVADDISNNFFTNIYFPSIYVYLFVFTVVNVKTIYSFINTKTEKIYRIINFICFTLTNFIFVIILGNISQNDVDVFSKNSLFANTDLVMLLELTVNIFIVWLISLLIVSLTSVIYEKIQVTKLSKEALAKTDSLDASAILEDSKVVANDFNTNINTSLAFNENNDTRLDSVYNNSLEAGVKAMDSSDKKYTYQFIPNIDEIEQVNNKTQVESVLNTETHPYVNLKYNNFEEEKTNTVPLQNTFDLSSFIPLKEETEVISNKFDTDTIFNQILNNNLPLVSETHEEEIKPIENNNNYTLNDYRIFNKMLMDIKEHNHSNSVTIDKNLEYRLITKYSNEKYLMFKRMLENYSN